MAIDRGYQIEFLSSDAQPFSPYYDRKTGKVYPRLPADPYSASRYRARGLVMGTPPVGQRSEPVTSADQRIAELEAELKRLRGEQAEDRQLRLL